MCSAIGFQRFQPSTMFGKHFILDVWQDSEDTSELAVINCFLARETYFAIPRKTPAVKPYV